MLKKVSKDKNIKKLEKPDKQITRVINIVGEPIYEKPTREELVEIIEPLIPEAKDGKDGKTPTKKEIKEIVKPLVPTAEEVAEIVLPKIPKPQDGKSFRFADLTAYEKQILTGPQGSNGVGVPRYGTTGQVLAKSSSRDFDTEWVTPSVGTGTVTSVATDSTLTGGPITTTGTLGINLNNANTWVASQTFDELLSNTFTARTSGGILMQSNNGTDIGILGAGNTANVTWYGSHNFDTATQDTIAAFVGSGKTLSSLSTSTYPSLTELSYVKGVTSAIQTQLDSKESALTFSTGLTRSTNTITANLSTGVSGGQSVIGGTASGNNLTLSSTSNATKGKILFGTSGYDEVNNRLVIGGTSSSYRFETIGTATIADRTWAINNKAVMYLPDQTAGQFLGSIFIGDGGRSATAGAISNTSVGLLSGLGLTSGNENTFIGYAAGSAVTSARRNVFIGAYAGISNTSGGENLFMGFTSGYYTTTGSGNTAIGGSSLRFNQTGGGNTAIGFTALYCGGVTANIDNTVGIGYASGYYTTGTSYGVYIGLFSGYANTTGLANTIIGSYTGYNNRTGNFNTYVGFESGYGVASNSQTANSALGKYSLFSITTGSYNTAVGTDAGFVVSSGAGNILVGYQAGYTITTGNYNILLGYAINAPSASTSNFMSLGNIIFATGVNGTGTTISSASVGIGTASPSARLHVVSTTEQLRLAYSAGNEFRATVSSAGVVTFDAVGASAIFNFGDTISPTTNGGADLGSSGLQWATARLSSAINFNSDVTITYTSDTLTFDGAATGYIFKNPVDIQSSLQCDSIVNDTGLAHGTYTPSYTGVSNISSITVYDAQYMRVGNTVTVSSLVEVSTSSNTTNTSFRLTLPIASTFTQDYQLGGSASNTISLGCSIKADTSFYEALFEFYETTAGTTKFSYTFTYQVL